MSKMEFKAYTHLFDRVQMGASDDYWKLYNAAFLTLSQDTNEQCVINLIKLTRNVVAGEYENQKLAM